MTGPVSRPSYPSDGSPRPLFSLGIITTLVTFSRLCHLQVGTRSAPLGMPSSAESAWEQGQIGVHNGPESWQLISPSCCLYPLVTCESVALEPLWVQRAQ